jgi:SPP1 family predicted phage head-tail adaptor
MTKLPEISELRHRVVIESLAEVSDGYGGTAATWSTLATVWASVVPKESHERRFADQVQLQRTHVCWIRHRDDVTSTMRILFDSRYFQIKGVRRPDEKKFYLLLDLAENQGT